MSFDILDPLSEPRRVSERRKASSFFQVPRYFREQCTDKVFPLIHSDTKA